MALGFPCIAMVFIGLKVDYYYWIWTFACGLLWPLIAYWRVKKSATPIATERNNLIVDTFLVCSFLPLMQFNILPSVLALTVTITDKISSTARNVLFPSFVAAFLAIILFGTLTEFQVRLDSSLHVIVACFPLLILHSLSISMMTNQLVRNVRRKNKKLKEYSRTDFLTGLFNKRYWYKKAEELFKESQAHDTNLSLILMDGDHFKQINDTFGHLVGDEVLCAIGKVLLNFKSINLVVGRLGGDEFAAIVEVDAKQAEKIAATFKRQINQIYFSEYPELRCSVSVGVASMLSNSMNFKDFFEQADKVLYQAKHEGRNHIMVN